MSERMRFATTMNPLYHVGRWIHIIAISTIGAFAAGWDDAAVWWESR